MADTCAHGTLEGTSGKWTSAPKAVGRAMARHVERSRKGCTTAHAFTHPGLLGKVVCCCNCRRRIW